MLVVQVVDIFSEASLFHVIGNKMWARMIENQKKNLNYDTFHILFETFKLQQKK